MTISRLSLYALLLCLVACGGGGGGGNPNTNDGNNDGDPDNLPTDTANPLSYNGGQTPISLNAVNAVVFISGVLNQLDVGAVISVQGVGSSTAAGVDGGIHATAKTVVSRSSPSQIFAASSKNVSRKPPASSESGDSGVVAAAADESEDCDNGKIDYYFDVNALGEGTVVIDYVNCSIEGTVTDGMVTQDTYNVSQSDFSILHAISRYNRLTTEIGDLNFIESGSVEIERFPESGLERLTRNIVVTETNSGWMIRLRDLVIDTQAGGQGVDYAETISGRFYDAAYGYIEITTLQPIEYLNSIPQSGELMLAGGNGSKVLLEFPGGLGFTINLDADGDDIYEDTATLYVETVGSDDNADIGDDDGDGMHNAWETNNGLDPANPDDADTDLDGDSISNLSEYRYGSNPDDISSVPASSDLRLRAAPFFNDQLYPVGSTKQFGFELHKLTGNTVGFVTIRVVMPPEFQLENPTTPETGCVVESNVITCEYTQAGTKSLHFGFTVPETPGSYAYEASIMHSSNYDSNQSNNVVNGSIEVKPVTAELKPRFLQPVGPVAISHNYVYEFEVENTGVLSANDIQVELEVPVGVTVVSSLRTGCTQSGQTVTCVIGEIDPSMSWDSAFTVKAPSSTGPVTASLSVTTETVESNTADNTIEQILQIITPISDSNFDLMPRSAAAVTGNSKTLRIEANNSGPHTVPQAQVTIDLPAGLEFVSAEVDGGECTGTDPVVCTVPRVSNSLSYKPVVLVVNTPALGIHEVTATISGDFDDPDPFNNTKIQSVLVGNPVTSIQALIDAASDGDTVEVPAGYYVGNVSYSKDIDLAGAENTFLAGGFSAIGVAGEITGFRFTHLAGLFVSGSSVVHIHDNVFQNTEEFSLDVRADASATIERNVLENNGCDFRKPATISSNVDANLIIRNNQFLNNDCAGISIGGNGSSPAVMINNHFIGNGTGVIIHGVAWHSGIYIGNNIFYGNDVGIEAITDCGTDCPNLQSNLFYNNVQDYLDTPDQNGDINLDPLFTDAANGDYTMQYGSPAIDAGNVLHAPSDDFSGNSRPVDGNGSTTAEPDIGAYEFQVDAPD